MLVLLFLVVGWLFYLFITKSYEARNQYSQQMTLNTTSEYVDLELTDLGRSMQQVLWDTDVVRVVLTPDNITYEIKSEVKKTLASFESENPLVESAYLLTYTDQMIYDSYGNQTPLEEHGIWEMLNPADEQTVRTMLSQGEISSEILTRLGQVAILQDFPTPEENGALLAIIDTDELFLFMQDLIEPEYGYMGIVMADGQTLYMTAFEKDENDGFSQTYLGKTGWSFGIWQKSTERLYLEDALSMIGIGAVFLVALSVILALVFSFNIYQPILKLQNFVSDSSLAETASVGKGKNELEEVGEAYADTVKRNTVLENELDRAAPLLRERLYMNLLKGSDVEKVSLGKRLKELGSPFDADAFYMVVMGGIAESQENTDVRMMNLYQRRKDLAVWNARCVGEELLTDENRLVVILGFDSGMSLAEINRCGRVVREELEKDGRECALGEDLRVGCGRVYEGILNLHFSYDEARRKLFHELYQMSEEEDTVWEEEQKWEETAHTVLEPALDGRRKEAEEALELYIQKVRTAADREISHSEQYSVLVNAMAEELIRLQTPKDKMDIFEAYYSSEQPLEEENLEKIVRNVGYQAIQVLESSGRDNKNRYVRLAREYIHEHADDCMLSLDRVADSVGIHPAYLSRLFYDISGVSFVQYVNQCRVERAKVLLTQTKFSIQETGFKSGFNSQQNFNRVFKKWTGMTPSAYRKQA